MTTEESRFNKSIAVPLVIDGAMILLGAYQLGNINTTLQNLEKKIEPISEAKIAVLQQEVQLNSKRIDSLVAFLERNHEVYVDLHETHQTKKK